MFRNARIFFISLLMGVVAGRVIEKPGMEGEGFPEVQDYAMTGAVSIVPYAIEKILK